MKLLKVVVAASLVAALGACNKKGPESGEGGGQTSGVENSAGVYTPDPNSVPGTNESVGGATGVTPAEVGNPPTSETTVPGGAMEPVGPAPAQ